MLELDGVFVFTNPSLCVSKGAQNLITQSLGNMSEELHLETLQVMPALARMCQSNDVDNPNLSNSHFAAELANFRDNNSDSISEELFNRIDAWAIAIAGMARPKRTDRSRSNAEWANEFVSEPLS